MQPIKLAFVLALINVVSVCDAAPQSPPTQVVYRFDDNRYLELTGFNCEGALWFTDTRRNIHSEIYEISDRYQIFTKKFIHPSERYIVIPQYNGSSSFLISKDYGKTWEGARFAPGSGAVKYGASYPEYQFVESITVVNDQGFVLTKQGDIYMSSKPFDDPRLEPGGSGIDYTRTTSRGRVETHHIRPGYGGGKWGKDFISWNSVQGTTPWTIFAYRTNFQGIPNKVPEVKNYTGWDKMRCDPNLGQTSK
ncbi:T6SS immunity protein Tli3 family protein [Yersinia pseudotuberculosis]|uniref:Tli3-like domain-containing protein n=1 Tax=Yersinia pseudotuberculosis TaxID=633 RepID=A0ABN5R709_YERPU|nr:hypothetical protein [Yersinia pseudotuberculosis]AIN14170.1 hypothetical protein DJ40_3235 [Yersinia pseudotuberculosis]AXY34749.1 hypothetical protein CEQ20_16080 [Yersinia pseudotuberculosis]AYW92022.1 hypothetical protein EGX47_12410 [Yersinia pseudotuberculosis]AYX10352.1 hypothetical protein EGX52_05770 [Yersinia pseudotuberculosis]MBO1567843.1 hypothetical protein [Yersinia pseudotuberculosis]